MDIKLLNQVRSVTKGIVIFDVVLIVLMLITSTLSKPVLLGLIFGSIIAMLNFRLLAISLEKSVTFPAGKAQAYASAQYAVRLFIMAVVLIASATVPHLNIIGTPLGLLSTKFVILSKNFINKLKRKEA